MKCLHPADHELKAQQVPRGTNNSVTVTMDEVFDINLSDATGACPVRLIQIPHALVPLIVEYDTNRDGSFATKIPFCATCWGASQAYTGYRPAGLHSNLTSTFRSCAEFVRLTSQCVTAELVAPATANQGRVICAQVPLACQEVSLVKTTAASSIWASASIAMKYCDLFDAWPDKDTLLASTRAYTAEAIQGCYVPLRLTDHFQYHAVNSLGRSILMTNNNPVGLPLAANSIPGTLATMMYPFDSTSSSDSWNNLAMIGNTAAVTYFDRCDATAGLHVRIRATYEVRPGAASPLACMSRVPPLPDELALRMVDEIGARMNDAYPASYNDWETLKRTIKNIGRAVLPVVDPMISAVTAGLPMGGAIGSIAHSIVGGIRKKLDEDADKMSKEERARVKSMGDVAQVYTKQLKALPVQRVVYTSGRARGKRIRVKPVKKQATQAPRKLKIIRPARMPKDEEAFVEYD